mmetsp:Transcript_21248/g.49871  ORF Transcript_21248/g.49871 Transcript_21248/m.49871 type:complete len:836 (+) Transcript_21248:66-2573(+)
MDTIAPQSAAPCVAETRAWLDASVPALIFLGVWFMVLNQIVRIVWHERRRFRDKRAAHQAGFFTYLTYRFGHWYAWTPGASVKVLLVMSATLLVLGGLGHSALSRASIQESLWRSWIWIADPDGGESAHEGGHVVGVVVSIGGMLIFALLLSLITSSFEEFLWHLRHGSIPVVEGDHIVILGYDSSAVTMIEELCSAMEQSGGGLIAILSCQGKAEVEHSIQEAGINLRNSEVVVRSGQPSSEEDLTRVAVQTARRIVVLANKKLCREEADCRTLNVLLALQSLKYSHSKERCTVVECCLVRNQNLFRSLAAGKMQVLATQDFIGQLLVEASRQRGISQVISQTIGFDGMEFYIADVQGLQGWTFRDLLFALGTAIPIGYVAFPENEVVLLPPMSYVFSGLESLICLAEDSSTLPQSVAAGTQNAVARKRSKASKSMKSRGSMGEVTRQHEAIVIVFGWNEAIGSMMFEVDLAVGAHSTVIVYSPQDAAHREEYLEASQVRRNCRFQNITVKHKQGLLGARYKLEQLPLDEAEKIFILADSSSSSDEAADCDTVATLLQVRDILRERGKYNPDLVIMPQVLGKRAEHNCWKSGLIDYINSNRLSCQVLAQVCQSPEICTLFAELLLGDTARICIRHLGDYVLDPGDEDDYEGKQINFNEVLAAVSGAGEVAIGWSRSAEELEKKELEGQMLWQLNPPNWDETRRFTAEDMLIVIAKPAHVIPESGPESRPFDPDDVDSSPVSSPVRSIPEEIHDSPERSGTGSSNMGTVMAALRFRKALRKQTSFWSASGSTDSIGSNPAPFSGAGVSGLHRNSSGGELEHSISSPSRLGFSSTG